MGGEPLPCAADLRLDREAGDADAEGQVFADADQVEAAAGRQIERQRRRGVAVGRRPIGVAVAVEHLGGREGGPRVAEALATAPVARSVAKLPRIASPKLLSTATS